MATFLIIGLLAILVMLAASDVAAIRQTQRELKLIDQRQQQRLKGAPRGSEPARTSGPRGGQP